MARAYTQDDVFDLLKIINDHLYKVEEIDNVDIKVNASIEGYDLIAVVDDDERHMITRIENLQKLGALLEGMTLMISVEHMF